MRGFLRVCATAAQWQLSRGRTIRALNTMAFGTVSNSAFLITDTMVAKNLSVWARRSVRTRSTSARSVGSSSARWATQSAVPSGFAPSHVQVAPTVVAIRVDIGVRLFPGLEVMVEAELQGQCYPLDQQEKVRGCHVIEPCPLLEDFGVLGKALHHLVKGQRDPARPLPARENRPAPLRQRRRLRPGACSHPLSDPHVDLLHVGLVHDNVLHVHQAPLDLRRSQTGSVQHSAPGPNVVEVWVLHGSAGPPWPFSRGSPRQWAHSRSGRRAWAARPGGARMGPGAPPAGLGLPG